MQKQLTAVALLALVAGTAMANPRESQSYPNPVNMNATTPVDSFTLNFTGSDGGGAYLATHAIVAGNLTSNVAGTWPADVLMTITPPGGTGVSSLLSDVQGQFTTEVINTSVIVGSGVPTAGTWTFSFFDTYADTGGDPQSILSDIVVTLDDAVVNPGEAPAAAIDLGTLVDGTNVSHEADVPAVAVVWFKFNAGECTALAGRKLTVGTLNSTMGGDSEMALYNSDGSAGWQNDDSVGFLSQLQFGVGSPIGVDLPAGQYYVAVGCFDTGFALNFITQFDPATATGGVFQLDVLQEFVGAPTAPADAEDLGTLVDNTMVSRDITLAAGEVKWYKAVTAEASDATGRQLMISTLNTVDPTDTEIGMYTDTGELVGNNDDSGGTLYSKLAFGFNGTFGDAPAGQKYIAVSTFNTNFLAAWNVTSTGDGGGVHLDVEQITSFPPTAVAAIAAASGGQLVTIVVGPGTNPDSTGLTARIDLSSAGGSATAPLYDDGTHGDVSAGDGTYSLFVANPTGGSDGQAYNLVWTVADAQARSVTGNLGFSVDTNSSLVTAEVLPGSGPLDSISGNFDFANDADVYKIDICDAAGFSASLLNGGSTADTQLFLFTADGMGVTSNDDDPAGTSGQSIITSMFVPSSGSYYLAVTRYNIDPVDASGQLIWNNTPFAAERSPDGPGAGNAFDHWTGGSFGTATYTVALTGTCYPTNNTVCSPADLGTAGGVLGHDRLLNNNDFIAFISLFFAHDAAADLGTTGGVAGSDGQWNNNDFIAFINFFFNDSAHCNG
ncbi:MAG: GC-type dockerin domain-anchored protein [Phycisphaerales bacterium]